MSVQVCRFIEVTRNSTHCIGQKEFKVCNDVVVTEEQPVCGEGDTFALACREMEAELHDMIYKQCPSYLGCKLLTKQSATDLGPSLWERFGAFMKSVALSCNAGTEYAQ